MTDRIRITRLELENIFGIRAFAADIPELGVVIAGESGTNKSSVVHGLRDALIGEGCSPDHIKVDAKEARLAVRASDDSLTLRTLSRLRKQCAVLKFTDGDGKVRTDGQLQVEARFGEGMGDSPLDFFLASDKERVAMIADAMPCPVTVEWLRQYVPRLPDTHDVSGNGLQVIDRLAGEKGSLYIRRTDEGAKAAMLSIEAARLKDLAIAARRAAPEAAPSIVDAQSGLDARTRELGRLRTLQEAGVAFVKSSTATREQIALLREKAEAVAVDMEKSDKIARDIREAESAVAAARADIGRLEAALAAARESESAWRKMLASANARAERVSAQCDEIDSLKRQAAGLEVSLASTAPESPTDEKIEAAAAAIVVANDALARARALAAAVDAEAVAAEARAKHETAQAEHARLDAMIVALQTVAKPALVKANNAIPGVDIEGNSVRVDGKSLDVLCDTEKMELSVDLWCRRYPKGPLPIDGIERISSKRRVEFLATCARSGRQVFATLNRDTVPGVLEPGVYAIDLDGTYAKPIRAELK